MRILGSDWATLEEGSDHGPPLRLVCDSLKVHGKPGRKALAARAASGVRGGPEKSAEFGVGGLSARGGDGHSCRAAKPQRAAFWLADFAVGRLVEELEGTAEVIKSP